MFLGDKFEGLRLFEGVCVWKYTTVISLLVAGWKLQQ